jgi:hypothetical protein
MNKLIAALGNNIRKSGKNWVARCPVHNDKDFAMSIKEDGNRVLAHCFACGANGLALYRALDLPLDELMGGEQENTVPRHVIEKAKEDRWFIAIYESDVKKGIKPTLSEKRRYRMAKERVRVL